MRTKTIETLIDRVFWALVLILPLVAYCIINIHGSTDLLTVLNQFNIVDTNLVYSVLADIFGTGGVLEVFDTTTSNVVLLYMSYFVFVELIHIIVDVLLFIPRCCVAILDKSSNIGKI